MKERHRLRWLSVAILVSSISIGVLGTQTAKAVDTPIAINTTVLDFGEVTAGDTSLSINVTLTNTGGAAYGPINIYGGAPPSAEFSASQNCQGNTLTPAASCNISYRFSPTGAGSFSDTSTFTVSDGPQINGEDFAVTMTGVGVAPISVSPLALDFGGVVVDETSSPMTVIVTNITASPFGPVSITGGAPPTAEFNASQNCQGNTLAAGASCSLTFTFSPSAPGLFSDTSTFTIDEGGPSFEFTVTLTGCGGDSDQCPGGADFNPFIDDDGHIFENAIEWLSTEGITSGCNPPANDRFCPNDLVTRAQMAAFLVRAFGFTAGGGADLFDDDDGLVFETAIDRLGTAGVTQGCNPPDNNLFCPDDFVTRGQMAAFLKRAFENAT